LEKILSRYHLLSALTSRQSNLWSIFLIRLKLNFWDVGGQTTIRSYWRNYFEETDGIIWVVDSGDKMRLKDCALELHDLLKQEKLSGASLLVLCNKQDVSGSFSVDDIAKVHSKIGIGLKIYKVKALGCTGMQRGNRKWAQ
jgi:ADP-ribosylation factor-like protein 2